MLDKILALVVNIITVLFRRGSGLFKLLFVIDDFFRVFTMTILIPIFFTWLNLPQLLVTLGVILGLVIDIHDFISQYGIGDLDVVKVLKPRKK